jgi:hypothetical protein
VATVSDHQKSNGTCERQPQQAWDRLRETNTELLAALKLMDCPVCDCSIGHPMRVTDRCSFCAKARAAIAKAVDV